MNGNNASSTQIRPVRDPRNHYAEIAKTEKAAVHILNLSAEARI